jgi:fluoroacetyl-CoA thioesterase
MLKSGLSAKVMLKVSEQDTAIAHRSGDVDVLATPRLVALCEEACCAAIKDFVDIGQTTVGMRVQFDHLAPSPIGDVVYAEATLQRIEGKRLTFSVNVKDSRGLVAAGVLVRALVNREEFLKKATL